MIKHCFSLTTKQGCSQMVSNVSIMIMNRIRNYEENANYFELAEFSVLIWPTFWY